MAKSGLKVDKSFKCKAFIEAGNVVNNRFPNACMDADNVENHMHKLKQKYQDIKKLMNLSGVGWNDWEKMLVLKDETYRHPKAKKYLNKPIPLFEELRLVARDDHATGDYAQSIYDQFGGTIHEDDHDTIPDNVPGPNEPMDCKAFVANNRRHEVLRSNASKTTTKSSRTTRTMCENVGMEIVGDKLGQLATSINRARKKASKEKLSDALWDMEGYDDKDMGMDANLGWCFL
ncbi:uncharacterized protein LOC120284034 [Dioscorea cayenensis subsp. rotundata]|uniref:Uncharacterized protein LOC120284034 n=1 Tax=Dioscorea cayennensis subsp. rotundata TaxID=55577 RepID=A0AB40D8T4_DIOCR|nr:uncharacterized protein LOC120284034 [Dioscorea cayenensis subsp. rotundata]